MEFEPNPHALHIQLTIRILIPGKISIGPTRDRIKIHMIDRDGVVDPFDGVEHFL